MSFARADDPLSLPAPVPPSRRSPFPVLAGIVPVAGGVVMWSMTGSVFALWFALLGPVIAAAALLDGVRAGRRERRRGDRTRADDLARLEAEIGRRHDRELSRLRATHPDVSAFAARGDEVWRADGERAEVLVIGSGERDSAVRVATSGADDPEAVRVRAAAGVLVDAPVTVPWRRGIGVVGDPVRAAAVLRGVVVQACLVHPPTSLRIVGETPDGWEWLDELPHRGLGDEGAVRVVVRVPGVRGESGGRPGDVVLAWTHPDAPVDPRCGVTLDVRGLEDAVVIEGSSRRVVSVEALAAPQARALARIMAVRSRALFGSRELGGAVALRDVWRAPGVGAPGGLAAAIGRQGDAASVVDLVADGPHAVITGVTGSGKSELLTTWVTALCAAYSTDDVSFLLADFKGGTAFDALRTLPHVTGVITDLDGGAAARAMSSLRAELRRREAALAEAGARDIGDPRVRMPRLVIVVDEYAALLADHGDLQAVFADVAARGRALGMHLILGTQRATGVIRDALLGNCPLRISLRVTDASDSRLVLGTDEAARLPGGTADRGHALVRRAGDTTPQPLRVALADAETISRIAADRADEPRPRAAWLPPLPEIVVASELERLADDAAGAHGIPIALVDDPERQRRAVWSLDLHRDPGLIVIGGPGSGKSGVARLCADGAARTGVRVVVVPSDPELGWDALVALGRRLDDPRGAGAASLVVMDDLDVLFARLPPEYAAEAQAMVEQLVRRARESGTCVIVTAQRLTAPLARIGELIPQRATLSASTSTDRAVGDAEGASSARIIPGRGETGGRIVQFAAAPEGPGHPTHAAASEWTPARGVTALLARTPARAIEALTARGVRARSVSDVGPGEQVADLVTDAPLVLVGDVDAWQQRWSLLTRLRAEHDVVIDAACPAEYRALTGSRELPPFARTGAGRGWLLRHGETIGRIELPRVGGTR